MTLYTTTPSPLGELLLAGEESDGAFALASVTVPDQRRGAVVLPHWRRDPVPFKEALSQLEAYFAGELKQFDLPLAPVGTPFRRRVWQALDEVPYGSTTTYRRLSEAAGSPGAVRAVGGAVGANPLLVIRACHRVIGSDGTLTGYAGGLDRKRSLLTIEGALLV
ncbi:methylated-DNA--[protein]-cysteine S-methyltransferase [Wenjunlia tyrosinilytica]|uniref:Methylated-DNA--protein-cysteine methyltransferase n=1 Tax=Wenjunlia tyrosinilytica TaxID=1544741 RepID=A0A917ZT51_9ACTN|nr:methylated-DNA--[protein]-cysteine S-methyltransferase [Wenjunlia tyrosinilytica]GGO92330.1 methylated-DNA--protein-cysteine methyltransferase [Wenjunlia tyrosinilytica]